MNEFLSCDVVLLPEAKIAHKAASLSRELSKLGTAFTLTDNGPYPHLSLYMFQIKKSDLQLAQQQLRKLSAGVYRFELKTVKYFEGMRYIDAEYEKTAELEALHVQTVRAFNSVRSGRRPHDEMRLAQATGIAKDYLENYGTKAVYDLFRPHLTFTRLASEVPGILDRLPNLSDFSGTFDKIGLFELGEDGTCIREFASINLN